VWIDGEGHVGDPDRLAGEMDMHPVAVELGLVDPAVAGGTFAIFDARAGSNETGKRRLCADRGRLSAGIGHDQTRRIGNGSWTSR
jgi:hypothetical protein